MTPTVGAAAAVAALFFVFLIGAAASFNLARFRVYLLLGLSCLLRGVGYALKASNAASPASGKAASYLALTAAGYGISLAVICLLLGCWWKNSDAGAGLRRLSIGSRLLIAPVIALGPICGCVLAGLIYGDTSPAVKADAATLREAVAWGMLAVLTLISAIAGLATLLAARQRGSSSVKAGADPDLLVAVLLACCSLLLVSGSFRVAAVYHHSLVDNDATFYPLQALPELLEILLLLWPKLMPRAALGRGFARWWAATHHQGGSGSSGAITNASSAAESGTLKVAKGSEW